jgi:hypothetical protein
MWGFSKPFISRSLPFGYKVWYTIDHPFDKIPRFFVCFEFRVFFIVNKVAIDVK